MSDIALSGAKTKSSASKRRNAVEQEVGDFAGRTEHPVLRVPFTVLIDGRSYEGTGLSVVGAEVLGLVAPGLHGQSRYVTLRFNFAGFSLLLATEASIDAGASKSGTLALRFLDPTGPHLPQLRYILNSFVAGDLIGIQGAVAADQTEVLGQKPKAAPAARRSGLGHVLKRSLRTLVVGAVVIGLLGFVGLKSYERFFTLPVAALSTITVPGTDLRAIASGQIEFVDPAPEQGAAAFAIRTTSGDLMTINMPCECVPLPGYQAVGATVIAGETAMKVAPEGALPVVATELDAEAMRRLAAGDLAEIALPDGTRVNATLDLASLNLGASSKGFVAATLTPVDAIPPQYLGAPVAVRIVTTPLKIWDNLGAGFRALAENIMGQKK